MRIRTAFLTAGLALSVGLLLGLAAPRPAHAVDPTLKTLVGIVAIALGEPALNDALPLIDCVVKSGPQACVNVKSLAESEGKKAVKQFVPTDPLIQSAVAIIKAAYAEDWIEVLELTGTDVLVQVACKAGLSGGGPLKGFICGSLFKEVSHLAKPVLKQVLVAVKNPTPGNLLGLVAIVDTALACKVVPDFPGKDEICGPLGKVIQFAKDVAEEAAKYGKEAGEFLLKTGESILAGGAAALEEVCKLATLCDDDGGSKYMSHDAYYKYVLFPRIHDRVRGDLVSYASWGSGYDNVRKAECLLYYDYYTFKQSTNPQIQQIVKKILAKCEGLVGRLAKEANAVTAAMKAAPAPYVEAKIKPYIPYAVIESYDYGEGKIAEFVAFFSSAKCVADMRSAFPIPKPTKTKETAWDYVCLEEVAKHTKSAYMQEQGKIGWTLKSLKNAGCVTPAGWNLSQGIKLQCKTEASYQQCLTALSEGNEKKHCAKTPLSASLKPQAMAKQETQGGLGTGTPAGQKAPTGSVPPPIAGAPGSGASAKIGAGGAQTWGQAPQAKAPETPAPQRQPGPSQTVKPAPRDGAKGLDVKGIEPKAPPGVTRAVQPDVTSAAQLVIGTTAAQWGASVGVDAQQAHSATGGVCEVAIKHTARNVGLAPTGQFSSVWKNSGVPGSWSRGWNSIQPGGADPQTDLVGLKPGANVLSLTLDNMGQVQESNETNNQFRVVVNLAGSCGATVGVTAPSGSGPTSAPGPARPAPRR